MKRFLQDERGTTQIEYVVIGACIFLAVVVAVTSVGTKLSTLYALLGGYLQ